MSDCLVEVFIVEIIWLEFIVVFEVGDYGNKFFVLLWFVDFMFGYDMNFVVLFLEIVVMCEILIFIWGVIF